MNYKEIKERVNELNNEIFQLRAEALIDYVNTHGEKMNHFVDTLILKVTDFEIDISADPSWTVIIDELYVNKAGKLCFRVYNEPDNSIHIDREFKPSDSSIMEIFFSYFCA